ncbi:SRPBCC domain-containing protein [Bacteroidota bacterium]
MMTETKDFKLLIGFFEQSRKFRILTGSTKPVFHMADILHDFPVFAPIEKVFEAVTTPDGINAWWSLTCDGKATPGSFYDLDFGDGYRWRARVVLAKANTEFELEMTVADDDWLGTHIGFILSSGENRTNVSFRHRGWRHESTHYRTSSFCWAMYLRLLKRYVELGERVDYARRLDV